MPDNFRENKLALFTGFYSINLYMPKLEQIDLRLAKNT